MKTRFYRILPLSILLIALLLNGGLAVANPNPQMPTQPKPWATTAYSQSPSQHLRATSFTDWHEGTNQSTPEVDLTYYESYYNISNYEFITKNIRFFYKDGTEAKVDFGLVWQFDQGGVDIANQVVLNWSKLRVNSFGIGTCTYVNGSRFTATYDPQNLLAIIPGTAKDLNVTWDPDHLGHHVNNVVASISWRNASFHIGAVSLSTLDYTYQGQALKESIATFNVTANVTLRDCYYVWEEATTSVQLPAVFMFQIRHNATTTQYKYGEDIDWSKSKAFPTTSPMATGADFTIVAVERIRGYYECNDGGRFKNFTTNAGNSTGILRWDNVELGQIKLPTQYALKGSVQVHNTTRYYMATDYIVNEESYIGNGSAFYVCFDGFKYNESIGFVLDPAVIINNERAPGYHDIDNGIGVPGTIFFIAIALAGVSIVVLRKRRNTPIIQPLSFF